MARLPPAHVHFLRRGQRSRAMLTLDMEMSACLDGVYSNRMPMQCWQSGEALESTSFGPALASSISSSSSFRMLSCKHHRSGSMGVAVKRKPKPEAPKRRRPTCTVAMPVAVEAFRSRLSFPAAGTWAGPCPGEGAAQPVTHTRSLQTVHHPVLLVAKVRHVHSDTPLEASFCPCRWRPSGWGQWHQLPVPLPWSACCRASS